MDVGGLSDVMSIARSGITTSIAKLDVAANNIANSRTDRPTSQAAFQPSRVVAESVPGGGTRIAGIVPGGSGEGIVYGDIMSALADARGNVRAPAVDMATEMVELSLARAGVALNAVTASAGAATYQSIMDLMKPGNTNPLLG